jgi:DNA-binding response OmpR family regulator
MQGQGKILIIDDNPATTRLLESVLTKAGYQVVSTNEAIPVLALIEEECPDLIVLDICMPGIDGWELCRQIREIHKGPILILTILAGIGNMERSFQAGADAHISKPFSINMFLDRVKNLLYGSLRKLEAHRSDSGLR